MPLQIIEAVALEEHVNGVWYRGRSANARIHLNINIIARNSEVARDLNWAEGELPLCGRIIRGRHLVHVLLWQIHVAAKWSQPVEARINQQTVARPHGIANRLNRCVFSGITKRKPSQCEQR